MLQFKAKSEWMPDSKASSCCICHQGFGLFTPRHHCRACGILVCGDCCKNANVFAPNRAAALACSACLTTLHLSGTPLGAPPAQGYPLQHRTNLLRPSNILRPSKAIHLLSIQAHPRAIHHLLNSSSSISHMQLHRRATPHSSSRIVHPRLQIKRCCRSAAPLRSSRCIFPPCAA